MTIPIIVGGYDCFPIDEFIRPNADVYDQDYGPDPHWAELDDNSDGDTIATPLPEQFSIADCGSGVTTVRFIVAMTSPTRQPGRSDCQGLRYRFRFRKLDYISGGIVDVNDLRIREGTTVRVGPFDHGVLTTSYVTLTRTLSDSDYDSIIDHGDLQMFMDCDLCTDDGFNGGPGVEVAWCEMEYFSK